ncbi:hypothetical protein [Serratia sp. Ag1]|uniref:hypothetical protein n=1 Tax=Serratia sp. Ag1 TaxID=1524467 RepID=UPI0013785E13|nr:hypothetical protein [Serratia sp. Ag1]
MARGHTSKLTGGEAGFLLAAVGGFYLVCSVAAGVVLVGTSWVAGASSCGVVDRV